MNLTGNANTALTGQIMGLPPGGAATKRTLQVMVGLVRQYKTDLNVRTLAIQLSHACAPKDKRCELTQLQHFVRDQIRYVEDVEGVETVQTPVATLRLMAGDCDDKSVLLCALAASIGFPTRFCAIGVSGQDFSHVMAQAKLGAGFINMETIVPGVEIGWFPPDATCVMTAHV